MAAQVRVRYAPSPTGIPHVGNIRTALFNWLFARHHGGVFIVRIEDTDQTRLVQGAAEAILESLRWIGIDWDEGPTGEDPSAGSGQATGSRGPFGPYFQSQRKELYQRYAKQLLEGGHAYHCYCTTERLEKMRQWQQEHKVPPKYDGLCRRLSVQERAQREGEGLPKVVRFATPPKGATAFHDLIRGDISFENATLDDFVLLKSDGFPTYHLANIVDDHHMEITHVMRADEWVSSTPRHVLLYQAFGWQPPLFAHLPMILGPDRAKLSKRHGATSLLEYRDQGFLPETMLNFLALLGWSYDDKTELFTKDELAQHFTMERIGKTAAIFNIEKLQWMNGIYIRKTPAADLVKRLAPYLERPAEQGGLPASVPRPVSRDLLTKVVPLIHDRLRTLSEVTSLTDFFFTDTVAHDPAMLVQKGMERASTLNALQRALAAVEPLTAWDAASLEGATRPLAEHLGLKAGQLFGTVRVAVTGRTVAPPLFETMAVLGRERCLARMREALGKMG